MRLTKIISVCFLLMTLSQSFSQTSIRFMGNGVNAPDLDRIKIDIDDVSNNNPGPPVDIGASDFTIEFWVKAEASNNTSPAISCGVNIDWIYGNIIIDRDRFNQDRKYGISIAGGVIVFGVSGDGSGDRTLCGTTNVLDNVWHHVAVQRRISDGYLWVYIDGSLETEGDGPNGDISYPDDGVPCNSCCDGGNCNNSDPYIVLGAEKHDAGAQFPSYNGHLEELRFSNILRYTTNFSPASSPFTSDSSTMALYHFEEGSGSVLNDASGGPSNGVINYGGSPVGPIWVNDSPFTDLSSPDIAGGENSFIVLPNPTRDDIQLLIDQGDYKLSIFDITGKLVHTTLVSENKTIKTDVLPAGLYFFKVRNILTGTLSVQKVIKL